MHYDELTINNKYWFIRWLHRKRYQIALEFIKRYRPQSFLDYGAGTGSFIISLLHSDYIPQRVAAFEPMDKFYDALEDKLVSGNFLIKIRTYRDFTNIETTFEMVSAQGVLEHLTLKKRQEIYGVLDRILLPGGHFLVQVPIMTGVGMILRQLAVVYLKKQPREFAFKELLTAGLLGRAVNGKDRFTLNNDASFLGHWGFDHRKLQEELCQYFTLVESRCGPWNVPSYLGHSWYGVFRKIERTATS